MFKVMNPYERELVEGTSQVFRWPCVCNRERNNRTFTGEKNVGCSCSCLGHSNQVVNYSSANLKR